MTYCPNIFQNYIKELYRKKHYFDESVFDELIEDVNHHLDKELEIQKSKVRDQLDKLIDAGMTIEGIENSVLSILHRDFNAIEKLL